MKNRPEEEEEECLVVIVVVAHVSVALMCRAQ
jgi:hypothetical protein